MSITEKISQADVRFVLTILMVVGAIALLFMIFTMPIPDNNKDMAHLFVGGYIGWTGSVIYFWVGTSKGSHDKQIELNKRNHGTDA